MTVITLILHTSRELLRKATVYILAGISTLILIGTLAGLSVEQTPDGMVVKSFGNALPPVSGDMLLSFVRSMEAGATGGLFAGVVLFGVLATAGLVPDVLKKGSADLYLSRPLSRAGVLAGRTGGAALIMFLNIVYFLGGLWLIVGLRTGIWDARFLAAPLLMTGGFLALFALVAFLAIVSRSAIIAIVGTLIFQIIVAGHLEHRETSLYLLGENAVYRGFLDALYYIFPQTSGLQNSLQKFILDGSWNWKPLVATSISSCGWYALAWWVFERSDY